MPMNPIKPRGHMRLLLVFASLLLFTPPAAGAKLVDRVVAVVNDDIISLYELEQTFAPYAKRIRAAGYPPDKEAEMLETVRRELLDQLIDEKLTDQEIQRSGISVGEAEIDQAIERIQKANYYNDEEFARALEERGSSLAEYRQKLKEQILRAKLVNTEIKSRVVITQEDIKEYYESHPELYGEPTTRYHLRNIIMRPEGFGESGAVQEKMAAIHQELKAGADFAEMARKHSQSSMAEKGGDLGSFPLDSLSETIRAAVSNLEPGEFTPVLETDQGYQIFYLEDIREGREKSLEQVAPEIEQTLYKEIVDEKFKQWLQKLRKRSHIRIIE